ncbi:hypothetical protein K1T71_004513 [Dendrolimus kikuchii]|uniref:Uncharacterized protein n=1 Tax=Dendrolimus kikuchii TaxID=765133 RepID=A0ACC1D8N3_9NEOP|nr:hypothetical protein K1T71_004513 [Dendrolimus kikuchii]
MYANSIKSLTLLLFLVYMVHSKSLTNQESKKPILSSPESVYPITVGESTKPNAVETNSTVIEDFGISDHSGVGPGVLASMTNGG